MTSHLRSEEIYIKFPVFTDNHWISASLEHYIFHVSVISLFHQLLDEMTKSVQISFSEIFVHY